MKIVFTKINAGGNDFIFINNLDGSFDSFINSPIFSDFLKRVCKRGLSVGADGLVVASKPTIDLADVKISFYEPDGNEVEFCGNATACFVFWMVSEKLIKYDHMAIESALGVVQGKKLSDGHC
ncbi:MAG: diaminopimelate epimerase, partial [Lentisphaeria bacterium]